MTGNASLSPFNYQHQITGQGEIVIFLQGPYGHSGLWKEVVAEMKNRFRIVTLNLPLYELPEAHVNIKYLVNVLHDFIIDHDLKKIILVGHSVGGQVALLYTHRYPDVVKKLALVSSAGLMENSPVLDSNNEDITSFDYIHRHVQTAFYHDHPCIFGLSNQIYTTVQSIPKRIALWNIARSSRQQNVSPLLSDIDHPVLLLWGTQDRITPPEAALEFHELLPHSELKFLDQCGHVPMIEKPDEILFHLNAFLTITPTPQLNLYL